MIYTIGYEGLSADAFWNLLQDSEIETLVDVRAVALSRKPGFSKSALEAGCRSHGLDYVHLRALGCPQAIRSQYKLDRDWDNYTRRFLAHLSSGDSALDEALAELEQRAQSSRCALMCFEADPNLCHRLFIAQAVGASLFGDDADAMIRHLQKSAAASTSTC